MPGPAPTLREMFRILAAFDPSRVSLANAPWEDYVEWSIAQGLAPLAAYNLEYRLAGGGAPEWARERLMSVYQGSLNDNVMKLVNFKRSVDELEGRRVVLTGASAFAEALYPHVAFRPVIDIELLVSSDDVRPFANFLGQSEFRPELGATPDGADAVLSDTRTEIRLYAHRLGARRGAGEAAIRERALPMKVMGSSVFRPDLEDAILLCCHEHAERGYAVPFIEWVDLRELLIGAPSMSGAYSRPPRLDEVRTRARELRLERALFASTAIVARLFPELAAPVASVQPALRAATRSLLERAVVDPVTELGHLRQSRFADRIRRLLVGA